MRLPQAFKSVCTLAFLLIISSNTFAQVAGYALQFNGTSSYVSLPSSPSLTLIGNQMTIEAWVNLNSYPGANHAFAILCSGNENEYAFSILSSGNLAVTMDYVNPQANALFIGKSILQLNTWNHIAMVYDGSVESIYINGVVDTSFVTPGGNVHIDRNDIISIGAYSWVFSPYHSDFLNGTLDEVRVWNIGETPAQIVANMNRRLTGTETGLVGYWGFDEGSGTLAGDSSGNGNTGTLVNSPTWVLSTVPLPIQLASLEASTVTGNGVTLTWSTLSETNNYGFYVQRNGTDLTFVAGHGTSLQLHTYSYTDNPSSGRYQYRLKQVDLDGTATLSESLVIDVAGPSRFTLNQNYPNPFNPSTQIAFSVTKDGPVSLRVYDVVGREVATLVNESRKAGKYTEHFEGSHLASGLYMYVLRSSEGQLTGRMTVLK
jgi:hypothetical protein